MIPMSKLKKDVQLNVDLTQMVDVLKGIAAGRFSVLQKQLVLFEKYMQMAGDILSIVDLGKVSHPFARPRSDVTGVILVTSDAGFLGGLNARVVQLGLRQAGEVGPVIVIGEKGLNYLRGSGRNITAFPGIDDNQRLALAFAVRDHAIKQIFAGAFGRLAIVYPRPVSYSVQEVTVETFLPCTVWLPPTEPSRRGMSVIWESRPDDVLEYVVYQWIGCRLDEIFAMSRVAELAARVVHLESSYQELLRQGKQLKLQYFRAQHEVIDRSMREIYAAQLLSKKLDDHDYDE